MDLSAFAIDALRGGKRVCIARVDWASKSLVPTWITDWPMDLVEGRYGIAEPRAHLPAAPVEAIELVLTPGLGFDRMGNRVGRGGGFYDRFLATPGLHAAACGVCFSQQLLPAGIQIPTDMWDVPVGAIVTDAETVTI